MAYRKRTLRSMSPVTRKVARLIGEAESNDQDSRRTVYKQSDVLSAVGSISYLEGLANQVKFILKTMKGDRHE